ncbi:MAG TPA: hypothetical protein VLC52_00510 [Anaerolineae bacterium]|nr:hypothetical protein [Anaerolineae bacterium]
MLIRDAQREMRASFLGGFAGQGVSGLIWLLSAALSTWVSPDAGVWTLVAGGFFIFPLTQLVLRALGRRPSLSRENSLNGLGMQVAFTLPLNLPLVAAATLYRFEWFYPAFMIALGAHYLPFVFLYGMPHFALLAALLVGGGLVIGLYGPGPFALGGWLTGLVLLAFAFVGLAVARRENRDGR